MSILPTHVLVLLLAKATLPGQARAVRYALRVRVLPSTLSHEKLADNTQKLAASRLKWNVEATAKDVSDQECSRPPRATAPTASSVWLRCRAGPAASWHTTIKETQSIIAITNALSNEFILDMKEKSVVEGRRKEKETILFLVNFKCVKLNIFICI